MREPQRPPDPRVGVVAIGRNEGERLRGCLQSAVGRAARMVYVDSGSTDGSTALARGIGSEVVELDMSVPFTAARARNAGFRRLRALAPDIRYVQFVDGDCEFASGWLGKAADFLDQHQEVVVVCGRRRERHPDQSVYNALCDIEWNTPVGEARACGGDAMMRVDSFESVGGYREDLIAGEEPELCIRLRARGGRVWRLDEEMTLHDAAMLHFGQWWKRTQRAGYAFTEGAWLHGAPPEKHYMSQARRTFLWGMLLPCAIVVGACIKLLAVGMILIYPLQIIRIALGDGPFRKFAWQRAFYLVLGRFPEACGQMSFLYNRLFRRRALLIEYK